MRARLRVPACVALVLAAVPAAAQTPSAAPAPAQGQGATDARAMAEMLFFTARGLMEAGRYPEACAKLTESYRLDPAAGTLLNLAVCNEKIGKIASAWGEFRESLVEAKRANRPDREQLASERIAAIEPKLPFLAIHVSPELRAVQGLVITRNGVPLEAGAWDTDLPVDPGQVEVVESAPGYRSKTLYVTVADEQHAALDAQPLELVFTVRPPPPYWTARRELGAILFGAGLVAAGVGTYFGFQAIGDKKNSDAACPTDPAGVQRCTQAGVDAMSSATTAAWVSDAALGAGAVAGIVGALLFATGGAHGPGNANTGESGWTWRLGAGPRGPAAVVGRSF